MNSHAELSAQLALALGYYPESVRTVRLGGNAPIVQVFREDHYGPGWSRFSYRDPSVAVPVLEWLMREHGGWCDRRIDTIDNRSFFIVGANNQARGSSYDTFCEAIARAAIAVMEKK